MPRKDKYQLWFLLLLGLFTVLWLALQPAFCIAVLFCRTVGIQWTEERAVNLPLWMRSYQPETLLEVLNQAQKIAEELRSRFDEGERL